MQARITEETGLSSAFVSLCFNGKRTIPLDRVDAFAKWIGVPSSLLIAAKACDAVEFEATDAQLEAIAAVLATEPE